VSLPFNLDLKPTLWHLVLFSWLVLWTFYLWTFSSCEHFNLVNVFVCRRFHLVNASVLWTFSYWERFRIVNVFALRTFSWYERFRFVNIFILWVRNSLGNIITKMKAKYPHRFFLHQTLPKLGTKIPKVGETVTSDSFRISDHASVNPTRFGFRTKFYHVTFCYIRSFIRC